MEVWGGNTAAENGISVHGIDAMLYSQPYHGESNSSDIHYVSMCGEGRIARFVLAYVAGHGIALHSRLLSRHFSPEHRGAMWCERVQSRLGSPVVRSCSQWHLSSALRQWWWQPAPALADP